MLNLLNNILSGNSEREICIAHDTDKKITLSQFLSDIEQLVINIRKCDEESWLLFSENSYRFLVGMMALLVAKKTVIICANRSNVWLNSIRQNFSAILSDENLEIDGIIQLKLNINQNQTNTNITLPKLDGLESIQFFTSGSTGEPKQIKKSLSCLTKEIKVLEKEYSAIVSNSVVISSVSHLHIYGLLFKLLWPLISGRVWIVPQIEYPEQIIEMAQRYSNLIFVSSPALLSRLDLNLPGVSPEIIFSSGGLLSYKSAVESKEYFGVLPIEIYGSTETGGIACRQQIAENTLWTLMDDVQLRSTNKGTRLKSLHMCTKTDILLDDHLELINDRQFLLLGRKDRVIKIEEKRISLTEIEKYLEQQDTIKECKSLLIPGRRDVIGCAVILSGRGNIVLAEKGITYLTKIWKSEMRKCFEPVIIPRKWRLFNEIPVNAQSKVDTAVILAKFTKIK